MDEEYLVKWKDFQSNFFALTEELFASHLLTDVTLVCKDQMFDAHRIVLCVCSSYFRNILTNLQALATKHPIIFLKDVDPKDLEMLLQYMYFGEVKVPNQQMESFINAATHLSIRGLCSIPTTSAAPPTPAPRLTASPREPLTESHQRHPQPALVDAGDRENLNGKNRSSRKRALSQTGPDENQQNFRVKQEPLEEDNDQLVISPSSPRPHREAVSRRSPLTRPPEMSDPLEIKQHDSFHRKADSPPLPHLAMPRNLNIRESSQLASRDPEHIHSSAQNLSARRLNHATFAPRILPPNEPRKSGTCYFCKKAFMKNKQLMNHVCPKKPRIECKQNIS